MLVLAVQLLGYQIAIRQANGIAPTVITDDIMQELAQDELRLLVHAAHLNAMWGSDPSSEVGEGDWWFIEHYAGRAAERLQMITVESQNRGLVAELFVLHQMKMLAVSARTGDAGYVKAELDSLAALLSHQLNVTAYYQQRQNPGLAEMVWARMTATPALRENVEWGISDSVAKNAMIVLKERTETKKVENLPSILGSFDESNETNNTKGLLISTGLDFQEIGSATLDQILGLARPNVPDDQGRMLWLEAILTGQTDNIGLLLANIVLGFIPVINILVDVAGLLTSHSIIWISLGIIALICDIGSTAAFLSVQAELIGLPWLGRAVNSVVTSLAAADTALIAAFEMISQFEKVDPVVKAVNVWIQFFRTVIGKIIKTTGDLVIGHNLEGVIQAITDVLTGASRVWDGFKALCIRLEWGLIIELGINDGSLLLGRVINSGAEIVGDSEMLRAIKLVGEDLAKVGVELSDEAVDGLGKLTKQLGKDDLPKLMKELGTNPSLTDKVLASYKLFDADMLAGSGKIADAIGAENLGQVMLKYANDPAKVADINGDAVKIFGMLGNTVNANVLETAFQAGKATAGAGGPEALHTLALWGKSDLEKSSAIILAARAGRDYQTIQDVIKLITDHGNDLTTSAAKTLIEKMGVNSLQIGENSGLILLGKWSNGIDGGFANQARVLGADYFIVHPDVYDRLLNAFGKGEADEIFWMMDEAAIQHGIGKDMTFAYTTIDTPSEDLGKDLEILDQLDDIRNPTYNQAKNVILTVYDIKIPDPEEAYKKINFRMREILTAIKNNRKVIKSSDILFYLAP